MKTLIASLVFVFMAFISCKKNGDLLSKTQA